MNSTAKPPEGSGLSKIAHLDLKGVQCQPFHVLECLERFSRMGYTAVLAEYEDVFPYQSVAVSGAPSEVWTKEFFQEFLATAARLKLEIIPLQQTLGHLEYALRWDRYAHYRMPNGFPSTLHIGSGEAKAWLQSLLGEIIEAHPSSRFVHLGMDEARNLPGFAAEVGRAPLDLFLDYLKELCAFCQAHGRTPLIWSDMLEDYLNASNIDRIAAFRNDVILVPWDYAATGIPEPFVRFSGWRCSRHWLNHPEAPDCPRLQRDQLWFEDWDGRVQALAEPHRISATHMAPLFQAAVWKQLGFRVIGACGAATSDDNPLLPSYQRHMANIDTWISRVDEWKLDGLVVTAWARAQTCSLPDTLRDLHWPMFEYAGGNPIRGEETPFPGICREDLTVLMRRIGTCAQNRGLAGEMIKELGAVFPPGAMVSYEWRTLLLMLETISLRWSADMAEYQADRFCGGTRLPVCEWIRRRSDLDAGRTNLTEIRGRVAQHLASRYHGEGLDEWLWRVFDDPSARFRQLAITVQEKEAAARLRFAGGHS